MWVLIVMVGLSEPPRLSWHLSAADCLNASQMVREGVPLACQAYDTRLLRPVDGEVE